MGAPRKLSDDDHAAMLQMLADGHTHAVIAAKFRCAPSTVSALRNRVAALEAEAQQPTRRNCVPTRPEPLPVEQFAESAMRVEPAWHDEETDVSELWKLAERRAGRDIEKCRKRDTFHATFTTTTPVAVAFISDQHIGPGTPHDLERMRTDAELIRDTPGLYAILGGDGVDNHIKHTSAIMAARSQPSDQYLLFNYYLQILRDKIVTLISGNHDNWTNQIAGIDMMHWLAAQNKLCYAPDQAFIKAKVGDTDYRIAVRHQYRMNSSFNQTHSNKQWLRNFPSDDLPHIVCVCHHHEHSIEQTTMFGALRWFCRPGSYQITSSYSRQYGYNLTSPSCPTFVLRPDRHEIIGFGDVHQAVGYLRYLRGGQ